MILWVTWWVVGFACDGWVILAVAKARADCGGGWLSFVVSCVGFAGLEEEEERERERDE